MIPPHQRRVTYQRLDAPSRHWPDASALQHRRARAAPASARNAVRPSERMAGLCGRIRRRRQASDRPSQRLVVNSMHRLGQLDADSCSNGSGGGHGLGADFATGWRTPERIWRGISGRLILGRQIGSGTAWRRGHRWHSLICWKSVGSSTHCGGAIGGFTDRLGLLVSHAWRRCGFAKPGDEVGTVVERGLRAVWLGGEDADRRARARILVPHSGCLGRLAPVQWRAYRTTAVLALACRPARRHRRWKRTACAAELADVEPVLKRRAAMNIQQHGHEHSAQAVPCRSAAAREAQRDRQTAQLVDGADADRTINAAASRPTTAASRPARSGACVVCGASDEH